MPSKPSELGTIASINLFVGTFAPMIRFIAHRRSDKERSRQLWAICPISFLEKPPVNIYSGAHLPSVLGWAAVLGHPPPGLPVAT